MVDTFGDALRQLREAAGLTQGALAGRVFASQPLVARVERGHLQPQIDFAERCDREFGTVPLLATLAAMEGDGVNRRALLGYVGAAAAVGSAGALAELVRAGLLDAAGARHDEYDALVAGYRHRLTVDASPEFGDAVVAQLLIWQHQLAERRTPDLLRAVAGLGQVYGLWLGNVGNLPGADGWYRTAGTLAERSGDQLLTAYVVGRAASRGIYEGWTVTRTMDDAKRALGLAAGAACDGALEALAAEVHVHALTVNAAAGRRAVDDMRRVADRMGDEAAYARTLFLDVFGEARWGNLASTTQAFEVAAPALAPRPLWKTEARIYLSRAMAAEGDVANAAAYAMREIRTSGVNARVIGVAVRDLVQAVPAGSHGDALVEVAEYADRSPGPWETLRW